MGMIITPMRIEAFSRFSPVIMLKFMTIQGAMITMPMNPRTTEGKNPSISMTGFRISLRVAGQTSERKTARARLTGREITDAIRVTETDPAISGSIPNSGGS